MSTKGGIGKSVIVTNLAYILQKQFDKQILLIDSIPRFGTLDILLDIADKKSISYIDVESESDEDLVQDIEDNTCVHSSGLHLLRAGDIYNEPIVAQNLQIILEAVQNKYDYILIDTDSTFNDFNLAMVEFAHTVFFISTLSISCIRNLNFGIETIKSIYYSIDKIKILINRFNKGGELTIADVEKFLKHKVSSVIPEDYETVIRSVNKGAPFLTDPNINPELRNAFRVLAGITTGQKVSVNAEDLMKEETNLIKQITSMFTEK
jgi:pilus assembly protein CpaE